MSETMIERVARALYRQGDTGPYGPEDEDDQWHQFVGDACAAISAMREPTDDQLIEAQRAMFDATQSAPPSRAIAIGYTAMIDSALSEREKGNG